MWFLYRDFGYYLHFIQMEFLYQDFDYCLRLIQMILTMYSLIEIQIINFVSDLLKIF